MIGNDVIDLALARKESDWKRAGYLEKIFTAHERKLIQTAAEPDLMVWNLWSRKEAAYKIYNRQSGVRAFMPLRLECQYADDRNGIVLIGHNRYHTQTSITPTQIHTIAATCEADLSKIVTLAAGTEIIKRGEIPFVNDAKVPVSKSHHGCFEIAVALYE